MAKFKAGDIVIYVYRTENLCEYGVSWRTPIYGQPLIVTNSAPSDRSYGEQVWIHPFFEQPPYTFNTWLPEEFLEHFNEARQKLILPAHLDQECCWTCRHFARMTCGPTMSQYGVGLSPCSKYLAPGMGGFSACTGRGKLGGCHRKCWKRILFKRKKGEKESAFSQFNLIFLKVPIADQDVAQCPPVG